MKTTRIDARCPVCGATNDRATHAEADTPEAGCISLCAHCGGLSIFTEALTLRLPTEAEVREIYDDPETMADLRAARTNMARLVRLSRREEGERN